MSELKLRPPKHGRFGPVNLKASAFQGISMAMPGGSRGLDLQVRQNEHGDRSGFSP